MNKTFVSFPISDLHSWKKKLLHWANRFSVCCFLDSNNYSFNHTSYECVLAAGVSSSIAANAGSAFKQLREFCKDKQDWLFGHLGYDLKNELEQLGSVHPDNIMFPDLFFFVPSVVIMLNQAEMVIAADSTDAAHSVFREVSNEAVAVAPPLASFSISSRFSKQEYLGTIGQLQQHIQRGDCYEINFCQEFFAENASFDPLQVYNSLSSISPNPFAAFYKKDEKYLLCASPERYLKKEGDSVISQPIKGTWQRDLLDVDKDDGNRQALFQSSKERSENVMIVDLVRNDLSKFCKEGTVKVDELYGIYSFPQVHQMISTISGHMKKGLHWTDAITASFPMGSMTGAPKKRVMELIEKYERTKRNIFSGALGYIDPSGDFDFNVVIRSILYNRERQYLSYQVGSGITIYSDPEKEYEECLLKAAAMRKALGVVNSQ